MPLTMARIRITIDTEEAFKRAFLARAALEGLSPQDFFERIVSETCADELEQVRRKMDDSDEDDPPARKPKK